MNERERSVIIVTVETDEEGQRWVFFAAALPKKLPSKNTIKIGVHLETLLVAIQEKSKEEPKYIA